MERDSQDTAILHHARSSYFITQVLRLCAVPYLLFLRICIDWSVRDPPPRLVLQIRFSREPNKFQTKMERKEILTLKSSVAPKLVCRRLEILFCTTKVWIFGHKVLGFSHYILFLFTESLDPGKKRCAQIRDSFLFFSSEETLMCSASSFTGGSRWRSSGGSLSPPSSGRSSLPQTVQKPPSLCQVGTVKCPYFGHAP